MALSDKDLEAVPETQIQTEETKAVEEKPKAPAPKPPISRSGPAFPQGNQFR